MSIRLADYPQLALLAWNRRADAELDEEEAFALYEREWRWVDVTALLPKERALIEQLTQTYGHGVMNV